MQMSKEEYAAYVKAKMPRSPLGKDLLWAFLVGGLICCIGQGFTDLYRALGASAEDAAVWTSITLVFLSALLTGLGLYEKLAKYGFNIFLFCVFAGFGVLYLIVSFELWSDWVYLFYWLLALFISIIYIKKILKKNE